tara:strand:- start:53426 stop:53620 length:195 start_codon:yes stop_codon:yes gene_type:complete
MEGLYIIRNSEGAYYVNAKRKTLAFESKEDCDDFIEDAQLDEAEAYHDLFLQADSNKIELITYK